MKTTSDGYYNIYKRTRKYNDGSPYTELLFLYHKIPIEMVEKLDNNPFGYITNTEDREVDVKLLGESFTTRIIRPLGSWFYGQESFGVEISLLLSEYFGITIYKKERYGYNDGKQKRIAYITSPSNEYVYELEDIKKGTKQRNATEKDCPLQATEREKYDCNAINPYCPICHLSDRIKDKNGNPVLKCFCPKLQWAE